MGEMRVSDQLGFWQSFFPEWLEEQNAFTIHFPIVQHGSSFKSTPGRDFFVMVVGTRKITGLGRGSFSL